MKFWIGDPCYHDGYDWDHYLDVSEFAEKTVVFEGRHITAAPTMYGDGYYPGSTGMNYPVDAGLLGAVEWKDGDLPPFGMTLEEFESAPRAYLQGSIVYITDGVKTIEIETNPRDEEDEEDWSYCDEDTEID